MTELADLMVASLGEPRYDSPLSSYIGGRETNEHYVDEDDRVIFHDTVSQLDSGESYRGSPRLATIRSASSVMTTRVTFRRDSHVTNVILLMVGRSE